MAHDDSPEAIKKGVRIYISVFVALMVFTLVTVLASYLQIPTAIGIFVALVIACVKGSLVACFFMHLRSEKFLIFFCLLMMFLVFLALMLLPIGMQVDTFTDNL